MPEPTDPASDDPCGACGFDAARYTQGDILGTLRSLGGWWRWMLEGAPGRTAAIKDLAAAARADLARRAGAPPDATLDQAGAHIHGGEFSASDRVSAVHASLHLLWEAGRAAAEAGLGPAPHGGRVIQVNASAGGVPKRPVSTAAVGYGGLQGDAQATRRHHGRPWQALCLWSADVIDALAAEGHPITYGSAGENITVTGIHWAALRPGVRMRIGSALIETSAWAIPCRKNAQWFVDGHFDRMHHDHHPGWSRIYASVVEPGEVRPGDAVMVEP